jgi:hypothetical protein
MPPTSEAERPSPSPARSEACPVTAESDLLFGRLALENGLIDQVQLVAAFQARTRDKQRDLANHLLARGNLDADQRAIGEALVALHIRVKPDKDTQDKGKIRQRYAKFRDISRKPLCHSN